jgi:predicted DNA-binding protein YlxM (UPF0122 family)
MPSFFPTPHPDELLYSVIARCAAWRHVNSMKRFALLLFGAGYPRATIDLPNRLEALVERIPGGSTLTPELLIERNTLFPLYRPFLQQDRADRTVKAMRAQDRGGAVHGIVGLLASTVKMPRFLKYCPQCIADEETEYGEPYWHRVHQVPGVEICPIHEIWLRESLIPTVGGGPRHIFYPLEASAMRSEEQHLLGSSAGSLPHHLALARGVLQLLDRNLAPHGPQELNRMYMFHLREMGYSLDSGVVKQSELLASFRSFYGSAFLERVFSPVEVHQRENWLTKLVRNSSAVTHPVRHVLLMNFLGHSPVEFFCTGKEEYRPFGKGPWPCLNKIAPHYRQPIITTFTASWDSKNHVLVGRFACPSCGFLYTRRGPDRQAEDQYRVTRVLALGSFWETEFARLASDKSLSVHELARRLKVDRTTVNDRLKKLRGKCGNQDKKRKRAKEFKQRRTIRRKRWLSLLVSNPGLTRTELRRRAPTDFSWLYRCDRGWLYMRLPKPLPNNRYVEQRVDWAERDQTIPEEVIQAAAEIRQSPGKPLRVTRTAIAKRTGHGTIIDQGSLANLPKTKAVLDSVVESVEEFQVRRVRYVVGLLRKEEKPLVAWLIAIRAGIQGRRSECVTAEIEMAIAGEEGVPLGGRDIVQENFTGGSLAVR